jgi:hypothetical protein
MRNEGTDSIFGHKQYWLTFRGSVDALRSQSPQVEASSPGYLLVGMIASAVWSFHDHALTDVADRAGTGGACRDFVANGATKTAPGVAGAVVVGLSTDRLSPEVAVALSLDGQAGAHDVALGVLVKGVR